jgi:peroxiredoxin
VPHLAALHKKYGKSGLQVIGLSVDDSPEQLQAFVREKGIQYPLAIASDQLKKVYRIRSIPHLFIINKRGEVVDTQLGFDPQLTDEVEATVKRLLQEK